MKSSNNLTYVRAIDEIGRVVLPKELREKAHILDCSSVNISFENDEIILEKEKTYCLICRSSENIREKFSLCEKCIEQIKRD